MLMFAPQAPAACADHSDLAVRRRQHIRQSQLKLPHVSTARSAQLYLNQGTLAQPHAVTRGAVVTLTMASGDGGGGGGGALPDLAAASASFKAQGYLVLRGLLGEADLARLYVSGFSFLLQCLQCLHSTAPGRPNSTGLCMARPSPAG